MVHLGQYSGYPLPPDQIVQYQDDTLTKDGVDKLITLSKDGGIELKTSEVYEKIGMTQPQDGDEVMAGGKVYKKGEKPPEPEIPEGLNPFQPGQNPQLQNPQEFAEDDQPSNFTAIYQATDEFVDKMFDAFKADYLKAMDLKGLEKALGKVKDFEGLKKALDGYKPDLTPVAEGLLTLGRLLGIWEAKQELDSIDYGDPQVDRAPAVPDKSILDVASSLDLSKAVKFLHDKIPMDKKGWQDISSRAKASAFYVAGIDRLNMVNAVKEEMIDALSEGKQFPEVLANIHEMFERAIRNSGTSELNDHYLRTAYYTNLYSALGSQRFQHYVDSGVKALRYDSAGDSRVRPTHAAMHGYIARIDDPIWDLWMPPNGYNCRCRVTPVRAQNEYSPYPDVRPDDGFDHNPGNADRDLLVNELKTIVRNKERFSDFLTGSVKTWIYVKRPNFIDLKNLPDAPDEVEISRSSADVKARLELLVPRDEITGELFISFPENIQRILQTDRLVLGEKFCAKVIQDKDINRSRYLAYFVEALKDPFEIWSEMRSPGNLQYKFIKPFADGKAALVIVNGNTKEMVTLFHGDSKKIQDRRRGTGGIVYGK